LRAGADADRLIVKVARRMRPFGRARDGSVSRANSPGGQRQRIGIGARLDPGGPISSSPMNRCPRLDVLDPGRQIINLLQDLAGPSIGSLILFIAP